MTEARLGRPPRVVLLATLAFAAIVAAWSVLTPLAEAPDEPAHMGLVLDVAAHGGHYPDWDQLEQKEGAFYLCRTFAVSIRWCATPEERSSGRTRWLHPADAAPPKALRPHWDDRNFLDDIPDRHNQMPQHPPLYYEAMAGVLRVERAIAPTEWPVDRELVLLRLVNVLLVLPLPWLAWAAARRAGASARVGEVAAVSMIGIPQLTHIGGTLNNDNLLVPLVGVLAVLLAGVARGSRSWRTAVGVGIVLAAALLTKGFAMVLPPVVALAYVVGARSTVPAVGRRGWWEAIRRSVVPVAAAGGVALALAGWWYVQNLVDTGKLMPSIEDARLTPALQPDGFHVSVWHYGSTFASNLVEGFWGSYGLRSVRMPWPVSLVATIVSFALVTVAVRSARAIGARSVDDGSDVTGDASPTATAGTLAVCALPFVLFFGFVLVRSWVIYTTTGHTYFQQGRYLFAGVVGMTVLTAAGAVRLLGPRRALRVTLGAALAMQAAGAIAALHGWWQLGDGSGPVGSIRAVVAWNGWPDPLALGLLIVPVVPVVLLVVAVVRRTDESAQSLT